MVRSRLRVVVAAEGESGEGRLTDALVGAGFDVLAAQDVAAVERAVQEVHAEAVVADLHLGQAGGGLALARRLPINELMLFFTGAATSRERQLALAAGADGCLPADAEPAEIVAQITALLRRFGRLPRLPLLGDLVVDEAGRTVRRRGATIDLTRREFDLLASLARRPNRVVSKVDLLVEVWDGEIYDPNVVEVHMCRLRRKLGASGQPMIDTVRGVGYVLRT